MPLVRLAGGVDRATRVVRLLAALTGVTADIAALPVSADSAARAADAAVADLAREALLIAATATSGRDTHVARRRRRAHLPIRAALSIAASRDRAAFAPAHHRALTAVAAALAVDTLLGSVATAVVRLLLLVWTANCSAVCQTADWMVKIRLPIEENLDEAIGAACAAAARLACALDAAGLVRRAVVAAVTAILRIGLHGEAASVRTGTALPPLFAAAAAFAVLPLLDARQTRARATGRGGRAFRAVTLACGDRLIDGCAGNHLTH